MGFFGKLTVHLTLTHVPRILVLNMLLTSSIQTWSGFADQNNC